MTYLRKFLNEHITGFSEHTSLSFHNLQICGYFLDKVARSNNLQICRCFRIKLLLTSTFQCSLSQPVLMKQRRWWSRRAEAMVRAWRRRLRSRGEGLGANVEAQWWRCGQRCKCKGICAFLQKRMGGCRHEGGCGASDRMRM